MRLNWIYYSAFNELSATLKWNEIIRIKTDSIMNFEDISLLKKSQTTCLQRLWTRQFWLAKLRDNLGAWYETPENGFLSIEIYLLPGSFIPNVGFNHHSVVQLMILNSIKGWLGHFWSRVFRDSTPRFRLITFRTVMVSSQLYLCPENASNLDSLLTFVNEAAEWLCIV